MPIAVSFRSLLVVAFVAVTGSIALHAPVIAQTAEAPVAVTAEPVVATLDGFRSATFGDDVDAVRAAIKVHFGIEGDAVKVGLNTVERTQVMTVLVPDVLADGGIAQISYIFG